MQLKNDLQGRVKFPTGGKVREPRGMNRCDSGTDSKVWMEEDDVYLYFVAINALLIFFQQGFLLGKTGKSLQATK